MQRLPRHLGIHSGGMVICDRPVGEVCPVEWARMPGRTVLQWDKDDCAYAGLVKFDLLGLGMLAALHDCFDLMSEHHGVHWTMDSIPQEDPAVYEMLGEADTVGVFQVESRAQMATLPRLRPRQFYDLVIEVALIRPGPIQGGSVHPYMRRHDGLEDAAMPHPSMRPALGKTLGVPLFQEQMMQLAIDCAGFSPDEADRLRQAMSAKRAPERIEELRQRLLDGMAERGIGPAVAEDIYAKILAFSSYGFPESHAISFAYLVYASAWLKRYYPAAFTAALLRNQPMGFYAPHSLINDARRHGVAVRGVDVNASDALATLEGSVTGPVRSPRPAGPAASGSACPRCATSATPGGRRIEAGPPYRDLEDFATRARLPVAALEALATAGAFGCFGLSRREALWAAGAAASLREGQLPGTATGMLAPALPAMTAAEETLADLWATGTYGTHPVAHIRAALDARQVLTAEARVGVGVGGRRRRGGRGRAGHPPAAAAHRARRGVPQPGGRDRHGERHLPAPGMGTAPAGRHGGARPARPGPDRAHRRRWRCWRGRQPGREHAAPAPGRRCRHQPRFPLTQPARAQPGCRFSGSAHAVRPELHADPRPDRLGRLRHGVLPGALAAAAHDQQVAVPQLEPQRRPARLHPRAQQQRPRRAQRQDGHHGVLGPAAPDRVAVPGHAVPPVPVQAKPRGAERLAELRAVVRVQCLPRGGQHRVGQRRVLAVEAEQPGDRHHLVVHVPLLGPPRDRPAPASRANTAPDPASHPGRRSTQAPRASAVRRTEPPSDPSAGSAQTSNSDSWTETLMRIA